MRITRIILQALFLVLGIFLLINLPISADLQNLFFLILVSYTITILFYSVFRELVSFSFPRHIGILLILGFAVFKLYANDFNLFSYDWLISFLSISSTIVAGYFLLLAILGSSIKISFSRSKTSSYNIYFWISSLIYLFIILVSAFFLKLAVQDNDPNNWYYSISILLALFPYFNKSFITQFEAHLKLITNKAKLDVSFGQLRKMAKIRNFVFSKEKLIGTKEYQIIEADYRSTVRVVTIVQLALKLASDWNTNYRKLFVTDEYEKKPIKYDIVEKNENGICVIDDNAIMYHFGNYAFVKDKIRSDNKSNLFLLKNNLPIAKYIINEKITNEKVELINSLDYYGNTILFNEGIKEDIGRDYKIVFDRIYSNLNEEKQNNLLKELNKKAPTAFFTGKNPKDTPNELNFYVTTKTDVKKNNRLILCNSDNLLIIPSIIEYAKKMHAFIKYAVFSLFIIQLFLIVFALFNNQNFILILAINLSFASLAEIITKIVSKKLHHIPGQPANLDQSHQAA